MAFTEDMTVFFNTDEFAVQVTLDGVAVTGIFEAPWQLGAVGDAGMMASAPAIRLPTASVPASPVGKNLVHGAVTYTVAEHRPDGTGVSLLLLERAS